MADSSEQEGIILDACCIINLYASSVMKHVLETIPVAFFVARYVKQKEALSIKTGTGDGFLEIGGKPGNTHPFRE